MNKELLRANVQLLARRPEDFDMQTGLRKHAKNLWQKLHLEPCGTVCCLAGQIFLNTSCRSDWELAHTRIGRQVAWKKVQEHATATLGLTTAQAQRLFHVAQWPERHACAYILAQTGQERVEALSKAVEDFIATEGWSVTAEEPKETYLSLEGGRLIERLH